MLTLIETIERMAFAFVLFTVPFYLLILYVIGRHCLRAGNIMTEFNGPFFKLMFCTGIIDIITLLNNYLGSVFPKWGWFPSFYLNPALEGPLSHIYLGLAWGTGLSHTICVTTVALNRFVAVLTLFRYSQFWTNKTTLVVCLCQVLPGVTICLMTFKDPTHYVLQSDGITIVPLNFDERASSIYFGVGAVCTGLSCLLTGTIYIFCFVKLFSHRRKLLLQQPTTILTANFKRLSIISEHANSAAIQRQRLARSADETHLLVVSFIICLVECALMSVLVLHSFLQGELWLALYNLLCDIFSGINPYLLWMFSEPLRHKTYLVLIGSGRAEISHNIAFYANGL